MEQLRIKPTPARAERGPRRWRRRWRPSPRAAASHERRARSAAWAVPQGRICWST